VRFLPDETKKSPSLTPVDDEAKPHHRILKPINWQAQLSVAALFKYPLMASKAVNQIMNQYRI